MCDVLVDDVDTTAAQARELGAVLLMEPTEITATSGVVVLRKKALLLV